MNGNQIYKQAGPGGFGCFGIFIISLIFCCITALGFIVSMLMGFNNDAVEWLSACLGFLVLSILFYKCYKIIKESLNQDKD